MSLVLSNPVGYLQEMCMKLHQPLPRYKELDCTGPGHAKEFYCECTFREHTVIGKGSMKKTAKTEAAKLMLIKLKDDDYFDSCNLTIEQSDGNINKSNSNKNSIAVLQEYFQRSKSSVALPIYVETNSIGGTFVCECKAGGEATYGQGSNKKTAKLEAAAKMCQKLCIDTPLLMNGSSVDDCDGPDYTMGEKNPVSALQELCAQSSSKVLPVYEDKGLVESFFVVSCSVAEFYVTGKHSTKKGAKTKAASNMLRLMGKSELRPKKKADDAAVGPTQDFSNEYLPVLDIKNDTDEEDELIASVDELTVGEAAAADVTVKQEENVTITSEQAALEERILKQVDSDED